MSDEPTRPRFAVARWLLRLNLWCGLVSGLALLAMMIAGAADVIGTNLDIAGLQSRPVPAAFEFMATMMVVTVFLGTALAQARRNHIRVEVLVNRLPPAGQRVMEALQHTLSAVMWGLIAWFGWKSGLHSVGVGEYAPGLINFPVWPARLVLGFGATVMTVQCLFDLLAVFNARFDATDMAHHADTPVS
ncbi:MAG: TRAP transporter small permease [Alphaproteobacteria bacterium]|nr:TRAP transporter small permease [Alphaproteobacteria bacterium]